MKYIKLTIFFLFICFSINAQLAFEPLSITKDNNFLFCTNENLGVDGKIKTLYRGTFNEKNRTSAIEALSFYPMSLIYCENANAVYIQNKTGLYMYDIEFDSVKTIKCYPGLHRADEYPLYRLETVGASPNGRYVVGKVATAPTVSDLYLFDTENNSSIKVSENVTINPGSPVAVWSADSKYFIYQKNDCCYYYAVTSNPKKQQFAEKSRLIGQVNINNISATADNRFIWIENDIIWSSDPNQFFSRSIYGSYLRLGEIVGKLNFVLDSDNDRFFFNENSGNYIVVKKGNAIFYNSLNNSIKENPFMATGDTARFENALLLDNGNAIFSTIVIDNGKLARHIYSITKSETTKSLFISEFVSDEIAVANVNGFAVDNATNQVMVCTDKGAFCYEIDSRNLVWALKNEPVISAVCLGANQWLLGGKYISYTVDSADNLCKRTFASSIDNAGFYGSKGIGITTDNKNYLVNPETNTLTEVFSDSFELNSTTQNVKYRILSRDINLGFYKQAVSIKDLATGHQYDITQKPKLRYKLYQPEIYLDATNYDRPLPDKYEVALVFDCIKTADGMLPIIENLLTYNLTATFFVNGDFIDINKNITKQLALLPVQIGNMFQYYINLTSSDFVADANFIRQGLSTNEERFFNLTGKNFSMIWHAPMYVASNNIIDYGLQCGYSYISYNLDSFDWVDKNVLQSKNLKTNSEVIQNILTNLKPGQVVRLSTGSNYAVRDQWLFNDFDLLLSELLRSGYSLTTASDIVSKYRF